MDKERSISARRWVRGAALGLLGLSELFAAPGCRGVRLFQPRGIPAPVVFESAPDLNGLLQALHHNSQSVRQLAADVQVRLEGVPPLSGTLIVERPRRLRLKAGLVGLSEMGFDIGSNDDEFWFWSKASFGGQPPVMFFARHDQYAGSAARRALPIEPLSILDALGLVDFGSSLPAGPFPRGDGGLELRQPQPGGDGGWTKVWVVDPRTALVRQQALYDPQGELVAYANAMGHEQDPATQVSLPRRIELVMLEPDGRESRLTVDLANLRLNELYGDPAAQWTRPQPSGAALVDLARLADR